MANAKKNSKPNGQPKRTKKPQGSRKLVRLGGKTLEEIAREQGKELRPWTDEDFERMIALGKELFRSHKEREEFFAGIDERRRQSRGE